ncbi:MAG TPA: hemerythrin domain-containing protein [Micromonosporaceae bacterium]|nr:hemerythrin domain-containing protein [Micromonosporaceae bacterium]
MSQSAPAAGRLPDPGADRMAADAVVRHHAQLSEMLNRHADRLLAAAERGDPAEAQRARADLLAWLRADLVPHALAEEATLYPAAAADARAALLVDGMLDEHRVITELVAEIETATDVPVRAAAAARALAAVFSTHLAKENTLVVPLLVGAEQVSLAGLLEGMHSLLGEDTARSGHGGARDV